MDDIDVELSNEINLTLKQLENRCVEILQECILSEVYDKYKPNEYDRTYQLYNNVRSEIKDDTLYVYINTGNLNYEANSPKGRNVSKYVPYWINYGHNNDKHPFPFMYNTYPSRNFIERAKERIENELGLKVDIMNDYENL